MNKQTGTFLAILTFFISANAAFDSKVPIKWGKVTEEEFAINSFRGDSSVPAIVLCDFGTVAVTNRTFYTRHIRIKINKEEGKKYAKLDLPYRYEDNHDDVLTFKANVFTIQNGRIEKQSFGRSAVHTEKTGEEIKTKTLELPDVSEGSIVEFYYEVASLDFIKLDDWYFQSEIPTLWSEMRIDVPSYFYYLVTFQNKENLSDEEQQAYAARLQWLYDAKKIERKTELMDDHHLLFQSASGDYKVYVINNMSKKIVMRNLPGVSSGRDNTIKDNYPKLRFDLFESSGRLPWFYRPLLLTTLDDYENYSRREMMYNNRVTGFIHYRLDSWPEFNEKLLNSEFFGMRLIKHFNYALPDEIIKPDMPAGDKMAAIFHLVQDKVKWNGNFSFNAPHDLGKVYEKGEGNSGEMNLMLVYLLRKAGLQADPVLIRTNDLGPPEKMFPVYRQFNHVIAMVNIGNETFMLDATGDRNFNTLPLYDLQTTGWHVEKNNFGWIEIN